MTEYQRRFDQFRTTILSLQNQSHDSSKLRFISPHKWKNLMIQSLQTVSQFNYADKDLIQDLYLIISNISEDKFVQAIMSFQPLKPKFNSIKFLDNESLNKRFASTTSSQCSYQTPKTKLKKDQSIIQKGSIIIKKKNSVKKEPRTCQTIKIIQTSQNNVIIEQDILRKEFQKKYHPFKKIIDSFLFILENKYKNFIDQGFKIKLQRLQELITFDVLVLEKLFIKISQPYQLIYQSQDLQEVKSFKNKIQNFVKDYIHNNQRINSTIRKLMRHYSKKSKKVSKIQKSIPDFVQIDNFMIPQDFKIDGCYIQSINALMQFSQCQKPSEALQKLKEFRAAIANDVDSFYQSTNQMKERQISAEVQIQIIRFTLCKLKGWIPEIYGQLKYLQIFYGDQQIAYKYDDASYVYAGLITVFDVIQFQTQYQSSQISQQRLKLSSIK